MKKKLLCYLTSLFTALLFLSSCQKDIRTDNGPIDKQDPGSEENLTADRSGNDNNGKCRLTEFSDSYGLSDTYHYNRRGLCDEMTGYATFKQEYNAAGRLQKSRQYDGEELVFTIHFFYTGQNVTKEIWYYSNTQEIFDVVFYTFNRHGKIIRMESFVQDYYTVYRYEPEGNITSWDFYYGGLPTYSSIATFNRHRNYKNPSRAIPGIEYGFMYLNGAIFTNPSAITSEKNIAYDEAGNPVVVYDYDPRRTSYRPASQNYPASGLFFDRVTNTLYSQAFDYENCGRGGDDATTTGTNQPVTSASPSQPGSKQAFMKIMASRGKELRENIMQMRKKLGAMKKN